MFVNTTIILIMAKSRSRKYGRKLRKRKSRKSYKSSRRTRRTVAKRGRRKIYKRSIKRSGVKRKLDNPAGYGVRSKRAHTQRVDISQQWVQRAAKGGVHQKNSVIASTLLNRCLLSRTLNFKYMKDFDGSQGGAYFATIKELVAPFSSYQCPLYVVDCTPYKANSNSPVMRMNIDNSGSASNPSGGTPRVVWDPQQGWKSDGVTANSTWQVKNQSIGFPAETVINHIHYGRVNIGLNLYGAKARPVKWRVSMVRFTDPVVCPYDDLYVTNTDKLEHDVFWQSFIKHTTTNPLATETNSGLKSKMKILKQEVVNIDPAGSMDQDTSPQCMTLRMSYGIHKTVAMQRSEISEAAPLDVITREKYQPDTGGIVRGGPMVKDRVFCIIQAEHFTRLDINTVPTFTTTPSFDLNVHLSQYVINGGG